MHAQRERRSAGIPLAGLRKAPKRRDLLREGWARLGSNQGPSDYESPALTD
jgi:hypothetical protein